MKVMGWMQAGREKRRCWLKKGEKGHVGSSEGDSGQTALTENDSSM
jgi:hypothetical protein